MLVFGYHLEPALGRRGAFSRGFVGVGFFFVLSGFVLAWSARPDDQPWAFYARRLARIYPAYLVACIIAAAFGERSGWSVVPSLLLLQAWFPQADVHFAPFAVGWTLSCEGAFYLVFPLLHRALVTRPTRVLVAVVLVGAALPTVVAAATNGIQDEAVRLWAHQILPPARLAEFVAGMALALLLRRSPVARGGTWPVAVFLAGAVLVHVVPEHWAVAATTPAWLALIWFVARSERAGRPVTRWLGAPALVWLGTISYALYLVHGFAIDGWDRVADPGTLGPVATLASAAVVIAAGLLGAWALHGLVERPVERWWRDRRGSSSGTGGAADPSMVPRPMEG